MKRFSRLWWASILLSSVFIGSTSTLVMRLLTDLSADRILIVVAALIILGDIILALTMQAVAPTEIHIGPGERAYRSESPSEAGRVIADFDDFGRGLVSIRGETWRAIVSDNKKPFVKGASVRVVGRHGLTLVVAHQ